MDLWYMSVTLSVQLTVVHIIGLNITNNVYLVSLTCVYVQVYYHCFISIQDICDLRIAE